MINSLFRLIDGIRNRAGHRRRNFARNVRRRSPVGRERADSVECLEQRVVLAANPLASVEGTLINAGDEASVELNIANAAGAARQYELTLHDLGASGFNAAAVTITDSSGNEVPRARVQEDINAQGDSRVTATLAPGQYAVRIAEQTGGRGNYRLEIGLLGAFTGSRRIDPPELRTFYMATVAANNPFASRLHSQIPTLPAGPAQLDVNFDGAVNIHDTLIAQSNSGRGRSSATMVVEVPLSLDVSSNNPVEALGTLIVDEQGFRIDGTTAPNANVDVDVDGDEDFGEGSVVADANGNFALTVSLLHNENNRGANEVMVRATGAATGGQTIETLDVHYAIGTVVRFASSLGNIDVELLDNDAPNHVQNFLNYLPRYEDAVIHRSIPGFVIQGGGFALDSMDQIQTVPTDPAVDNEFNSDNPNERGTLSAALTPGDPDSFTSQWFFNVSDNPGLDAGPQNNSGPHTVFGRVIGDGMDVVDDINELLTFDITQLIGNGAFTDTPLENYTQGDQPARDNYVLFSNIGTLFGP